MSAGEEVDKKSATLQSDQTTYINWDRSCALTVIDDVRELDLEAWGLEKLLNGVLRFFRGGNAFSPLHLLWETRPGGYDA